MRDTAAALQKLRERYPAYGETDDRTLLAGLKQKFPGSYDDLIIADPVPAAPSRSALVSGGRPGQAQEPIAQPAPTSQADLPPQPFPRVQMPREALAPAHAPMVTKPSEPVVRREQYAPTTSMPTLEQEAEGFQRAAQVASGFVQGAASGLAAVPKNIGIAAREVDRLLGQERPIEDYATYQAGQAIERSARESFPTDPEMDESFWTGTLPRGAGSMAAFVAGGVAGKAAKIPALLTTAGMGAAMEGSNLYQQALSSGADEDKALEAWIYGQLAGTTEAVPVTRALKRFDQATGGSLKRLLAQGAKGSLEETVQEAVQGVASNLAAQQTFDPARPWHKDVPEAMAAGGILGGVLSGGVAGAGMARQAAAEPRVRAEGQPAELTPAKAQELIDRLAALEAQRAQQQPQPTEQAAPQQVEEAFEPPVVQVGDVVEYDGPQGAVQAQVMRADGPLPVVQAGGEQFPLSGPFRVVPKQPITYGPQRPPREPRVQPEPQPAEPAEISLPPAEGPESGTPPFSPSPAQAPSTLAIPTAELEVRPEEMQPRLGKGKYRTNPEQVEALRQSMSERGFDPTKPIQVFQDPQSSRYIVMSGHHRLEAAESLGIEEIPAQLFPGSYEEAVAEARRSNSQQAPLTPLEEAQAFAREIEAGKKPADVAKLYGGIKLSQVHDRLNLNHLAPRLKEYVQQGVLDERKAAVLGKAARRHQLNESLQEEIFDKIIKEQDLTPSELSTMIDTLAPQAQQQMSMGLGFQIDRGFMEPLMEVLEKTQRISTERRQLRSFERFIQQRQQSGHEVPQEILDAQAAAQAEIGRLEGDIKILQASVGQGKTPTARQLMQGEPRVRREGKRIPIPAEEAVVDESRKFDPERPAVTREQGELLEPLIAKLPAKQREVLEAVRLEGDVSKAAKKLGMPYTTTNSRYKAALESLRAGLAHRGVKKEDVLFSEEKPELPSLTQATGSQDVVSKASTIRKIAEQLSIPIRTGRIREKAVGIYKIQPEVIRTRQASDLATTAHELGHHINKVLWGYEQPSLSLGRAQISTGKKAMLNYEPLKPYREELGKLGKYEPKLVEGFAEYTRLWLTHPAEAQRQAPRFTEFFEQTLAQQPDLRNILQEYRVNVERYIEQPATAKILSMISKEDPATPRNLWHKFYVSAIDRLKPIQDAVKVLEQKSGTKVSTEEDAYKLARLLAGWTGKADEFIRIGTFDAKTLQKNGKSLEEILEPVKGSAVKAGKSIQPFLKKDDLDALRVYLLARRAIEKHRQGIDTGITKKDAQATLRELETDTLKQVAEELYRFNDRLLQYLVDSGFMTRQEANWIKFHNRNYVPFYRLFEGSEKRGGGGKSLANLWSPVKKMKGSHRDILDPLESIIRNVYTFINLADRNQVAQALVKQARTTEGAGALVELIPTPMKPTTFELTEIRGALEASGADLTEAELGIMATIFRPATFAPAKENVIFVREPGKKRMVNHFYQVHPELYKAITVMDEEQVNWLVKFLGAPTRSLRLGAVEINPEFFARNWLRDTVTAAFHSNNGFVPVVDSLRGLFHVIKRDELFHEWRRAGGTRSALVALDRKTLQNHLKDLQTDKKWWVARHPIEAMRILSEYSEAATRVGEYAKARGKGLSPRSAGFESREISLDFSRKGAYGKVVNMLVAFWNAGVQGTDKFVRTHIEHPRRTMIRGAYLATATLALQALLRSDDEVWDEYQDLPRWLRDYAWLIPTKGTPLWGESKYTKFIPIPKPFLWGLVYGTVTERVSEWVLSKDPKAFDELGDSLLRTALPSVAVTAAMPVLEAWANKKYYFDRPLVPMRMQGLKPQYQAQPWTAEWAKTAAGALDRIGVDVSPIVLENFAYGYLGGTARLIGKATDPFLRLGKDRPELPESTLADIPVVRAFAVRDPDYSAESVNRFYGRVNELREKKKTTTAHRKGEIQADEEDLITFAESAELERLEKAYRVMSTLNRRERALYTDQKLSGREKRMQLHSLAERTRETAKQAMQ